MTSPWFELPPPESLQAETLQAGTATDADTGTTKRARGRPKGSCGTRVKTAKFQIEDGVDILADTACTSNHPLWDWDGKTYPKCKRTHGPNQQALDEHSVVLTGLFRLAPNGYPDAYKLRDLLLKLHGLFDIFPKDNSAEALMAIGTRAIVAADRWRVMCKHIIMLAKGKQEIPACYPGLKRVMSLVNIEIVVPQA